jgi:glycosyltransferase involved in cell wall biosynthesis
LPTILCFSTVDWDYLWHRPQAVMSRFAQEGYRILYVDTLGLRSPKLKDLPRIVSRLRNRSQAKQDGLRQPEAGVHVVSPLILPFLNSRLARSLNIYRLIPQLQRHLERIGNDDLIIWVYLPTWTVLQCVEGIPHRMLVYESIDALASNPAGLSLGYAEAEGEILRRADLVIATSESLHQEKGAHHGNAHWVPSGVAEGFFAPVASAEEMERIRPPRIGFFGTIDHRLDLELMRKVARAHRERSLVLIGAGRCDIGGLVAEENVHFLGPRPHGELPRYLQGLEALWLPYVVDEFTRHVYPAKIFECLALGAPVVTTALPSLEGFGEVVRLVAGREGHEQALREALVDRDEGLRQRRVALARENSWEARFGEIRGYVEQLRS